MVRHDGARQLEPVEQFARMAVDLHRRCARVGVSIIPPRLVPESTSRASRVNPDVDGFGDEDRVLVDVGHAPLMEPVTQLHRLRKEVVARPTARGQDEGRRLRVEVAVEAKGEDGLFAPRPARRRAPPPAPRRGGGPAHPHASTPPPLPPRAPPSASARVRPRTAECLRPLPGTPALPRARTPPGTGTGRTPPRPPGTPAPGCARPRSPPPRTSLPRRVPESRPCEGPSTRTRRAGPSATTSRFPLASLPSTLPLRTSVHHKVPLSVQAPRGCRCHPAPGVAPRPRTARSR